MKPQQKAVQFLEGLKLDVEESKTGTIEIENTDIEQIENCIKLIKEKRD